MVSEITKGQLLCYRLGRLKESGKMTPQQVSLAKRNCVSVARDIARDARDILGANGITDDYQCGRHMLGGAEDASDDLDPDRCHNAAPASIRSNMNNIVPA